MQFQFSFIHFTFVLSTRMKNKLIDDHRPEIIYLEANGGVYPGTSTNFKCGLGLERGPPSLVRTIG